MLFKGMENKDSCEAANQVLTKLSLLVWILFFLRKMFRVIGEIELISVYF